jgi:8-oxo-dGTP diphosphatase
MIRRWGERVERGRPYRLRPGAYAILVRGTEVLLTHQAEPKPEIQLPGGGVDPGEGPLRALHREVLEETGWRIGAARRLGAYRRFAFMPEYDRWAEKLCHVYVARPALCLGPPTERGHTALWARLGDAAELLENPAERNFVRRLLRSQVTS